MSRYDSSQRRKILEAAVAVFAAAGLDGATTRLVAKKAGFNSALIYYYFENKEQLFEEAIRMVVSDFLAILSRHKRQFAGARARIKFLVNGVFAYYTARPERMRLMITVFSLYSALLAKILHGFAKEQNVAPLAIIQAGIRSGQIKSFAPIQLWWSILGMCMFTMQAREVAARLQERGLPWQVPSMAERRRQIVEILVSGLAAGQETDATERVPPGMVDGKMDATERVPPRVENGNGGPRDARPERGRRIVAGNKADATRSTDSALRHSSVQAGSPQASSGQAERVPPRRKTPIHLPIFESPNQAVIIFVTVCTDKRKSLLAKPEIHDLLKTAWLQADTWAVGRYIIMPDHIHLFCSPARRDHTPLKKWVQYWKALVSRKWPGPEAQPVWQKSFWDTQLRRGENYANKWEYVRQNPVRAGLCSTPDEWGYQGEINVLRWHD